MNAPTASPRLPRVRAELRLEFARVGARTEAARVFETGGWRVRFPRSRETCEAVIVNTGGGMAGGDQVRIAIRAGPGARALVTSQSQEKIYRADGLASQIHTRLEVADGAQLIWGPQETLLFAEARLERRLEAEVAADATLTLIEAIAFGRLAHGESKVDAALWDRWKLRRGGRLVFAEAVRIEQAGATLDRLAVGAGARAVATLAQIGPAAPSRLERLRECLAQIEADGGLEAGASCVEGLLVARLASPSPQRLRQALVALWPVLTGQDAPRVWY